VLKKYTRQELLKLLNNFLISHVIILNINLPIEFFNCKSSSLLFRSLIAFLLILLTTSNETSSSGTSETDLLTRGSELTDGRRVTDMLVVTTSVGMVHGVHGHTSDSGPHLPLGLEFVVLDSGLEDGLIGSSSSGDDADGGPTGALHGLSGTGGESESGLGAVLGVSDHGGVAPGGPGEGSSVSDVFLDVRDDGTLGDLVDGEDVSDGESGLHSAIDELTGVGSFSGQEVFLSVLIFVRIMEVDLGEGSTSAWLVDNLFNHTLDVSMSLRIIENSVLRGSNSVVLVRFIDTISSTLSLC